MSQRRKEPHNVSPGTTWTTDAGETGRRVLFWSVCDGEHAEGGREAGMVMGESRGTEQPSPVPSCEAGPGEMEGGGGGLWNAVDVSLGWGCR